jgi:hypothetical protein
VTPAGRAGGWGPGEPAADVASGAEGFGLDGSAMLPNGRGLGQVDGERGSALRGQRTRCGRDEARCRSRVLPGYATVKCSSVATLLRSQIAEGLKGIGDL